MRHFLGIDLGTTYFKAGLFDGEGRLRGLGRVAVEKEESDGRCELHVATFWRLLSDAVREALASAGATGSSVAAVGYSSQANSFVLLDASGTARTPLVLWPDRRAEGLEYPCNPWRSADFLARTGVGVESPEFAAHKLVWFQREEPGLWKEAVLVQTLSDYFVFGLTGLRRGDRSTASMLGLWEPAAGRWWVEGLRTLELDPGRLSEPLDPGTVAGPLTPDGAARVGLPVGIPLVVGGLDHYVAAVGAGLGTTADVSESTGTVLACVAMTDRFDPQPEACVGPTHPPVQFYELRFNDRGTALLDRYRARFAPDRSIPELLEMADTAPPGCDGLRVRSTIAGWDSPEDVFENIRADHGPGHFVRALIEANVAALAGLLDGLGDGRRAERIVATGGGARSDVWLQIKADMLGIEVVRSACEEPACQGAAWLAARGVGHACDAGAWQRVRRRFWPRSMGADIGNS